MTIREATLDDIPSLLILGRNFIEKTEYRRTIKYNAEQMTRLGSGLITGPNGVVFVSENG